MNRAAARFGVAQEEQVNRRGRDSASRYMDDRAVLHQPRIERRKDLRRIGGVCLTHDALIFTYTDGLTDVRNKAGDDFGEDKLTLFLLEHADLSAKALNSKLLAHVENFRERTPFPDDITVLTCKVF